jgi:glutaredoxin
VTTSRLRPHLTVYSRAWCHLCDDLLAALGPICEEMDADIEVVDIDVHPEFEQAHGERVPVVMGDGMELCHYFLDATAVRAYLLNFR